MAPRRRLMNKLNELLNVSHNWHRLNSFDLESLVNAIEEKLMVIKK